MPIKRLKRQIRHIKRKTHSFSTIVKLTLTGNQVEKSSNLKNCKRPVLMIYGFGATRRTLAILENRLKNDGYTIFSLNLGGIFGIFNTDSIEETAKIIDKKVEHLYKKFKIQGQLAIVGHSKGGLIGQYYIKYLNGATRVRTFITIGTPHNGNPWAMLASYTPLVLLSKSLKQMSPNNHFIADLKKRPFPKGMKVYSIYSKDDTVCPFPTSVLEAADNIFNIEVFGVSHSEMLIKKSVFNAIKHGLQHDMPESWKRSSQASYEAHVNKNNKN